MIFQCPCTFQFNVLMNPEALHTHIQQCQLMQNAYGRLYSMLGEYRNNMDQAPSKEQQDLFIKNVIGLLIAFRADVEKTFGDLSGQ